MRIKFFLAIIGVLAVLAACVGAPPKEVIVAPPDAAPSVRIADLEAAPGRFIAGHPVDFTIKVKNLGDAADGFDIGVFNEERLVGWEMNKYLSRGINVFRLRDYSFFGNEGAYIVKVRHRGRILDERYFSTRRTPDGRFVLDPSVKPSEQGTR